MSTLNTGMITPTQGDPTYRNNWAQAIVNPNMGVIDAYTSLPFTKSVAGSTNDVLTLGTASVGEAQHTHFILTGILTGNKNVLWPAGNSFKFTAENQTTGAFTLSIGADNGSGMPAGTTVALSTTSGLVEFFSDGTNVKAISPPLAAIANGTMLANQSGSSAVPVASPIPVLSGLSYLSSTTFNIDANANASTIYKFTVVGSGGGGGGATQPNANAAGGGAGAIAIAYFSGFTPGQTVTLTVGNGGSAGSTSGGTGGTGGTVKVTVSGVDIITGGAGYSGSFPNAPGTPGTATITAGASGLTLISSYTGLAEYGEPGVGNIYYSAAGGSCMLGRGGVGVTANSNGSAGLFGGGGGAAFSGGSTNRSGGAGGKGGVIVERVL
jgi:hypothetical protein